MTRAHPRHGVPSSAPEHCATETLERVGVVDTDMMGVVHHGSYVAWFERGRLEYLRRRGLPYSELVARRVHLPVVELNVRYKKPARFDDVLRVQTRLGPLTRVTVRFDYCIRRDLPAGGSELLLEAHVVLACVDDQGKPRALPEDAARAVFEREAPGPHS